MTTEQVSLNTYLCTIVMLDGGANWFTAIEAVASTAIEHPEWPDLQERRTWEEWEEWNDKR